MYMHHTCTQHNTKYPKQAMLSIKYFLWSLSGSNGSECSGQWRSRSSAFLLSIWTPWNCKVLTPEQLRSSAPCGEYLWRHTFTSVSHVEKLSFTWFGPN